MRHCVPHRVLCPRDQEQWCHKCQQCQRGSCSTRCNLWRCFGIWDASHPASNGISIASLFGSFLFLRAIPASCVAPFHKPICSSLSGVWVFFSEFLYMHFKKESLFSIHCGIYSKWLKWRCLKLLAPICTMGEYNLIIYEFFYLLIIY